MREKERDCKVNNEGVQLKTGRWINIKPLLTAARCSECKSAFADKTNYCPKWESDGTENG